MSDELKDGGLFVDTKPAPARPIGAPPSKKDVKKRWMLVGIGITGFALVVSSLLSSDPPPPPEKEERTQMIDLTPKGVDERAWQVRSQADIQQMKQENDRLKADLYSLRNEIDKIKNAPPPVVQQQIQLPAGVVPPPTAGDASPPPLAQPSVPLPPVPPSVTPPSTGGRTVPPPFTSGFDEPALEPMVFKPTRASVEGPEVAAKVKYRRNDQSGMLVAGAFAPIVILNGIDAATSSGARTNPMPLLMRVQDHATLPGASKYSLRSCFVLGSGYGELSSERVYIRLARLSCVDKNDRLVLSVPVQGYVVDSDGTLGMRGKVTDRQGARLGKALLAGFAQGLAGALGGAQGTMTSSVLGNSTSLTGDAAMRASGLSGASTAAGQLAEFYLREAQNIFPVISIQGGRDANIVFTEDANLAWGNVDEQFVRDVEPDVRG